MTKEDKQLLTAAEYFFRRKEHIERYVEGEHKWFGTRTGTEHSYNPSPIPWYHREEQVLSRPQGVF